MYITISQMGTTWHSVEYANVSDDNKDDTLPKMPNVSDVSNLTLCRIYQCAQCEQGQALCRIGQCIRCDQGMTPQHFAKRVQCVQWKHDIWTLHKIGGSCLKIEMIHKLRTNIKQISHQMESIKSHMIQIWGRQMIANGSHIIQLDKYKVTWDDIAVIIIIDTNTAER